jgi:hypothetical protein
VRTSHAANREQRSRPSARIAEIIHIKALLAGLLEPRDVGRVSPVNDCGNCGRLRKRAGRNQRRPLARCPTCAAPLKPWPEGSRKWKYCDRCKATWPGSESWFTCERCKAHLPTRVNLALVTARYAIDQLIIHHGRLQVKRLAE